MIDLRPELNHLGRILGRLWRIVRFVLLCPAAALLPVAPALLLMRALNDQATPDDWGALRRAGRVAGAALLALLATAVMIAFPVMLVKMAPPPVQPWVFVLLVIRLEDLALLVAVGRVPLTYNLRNLAVRWKTTFVTALAFTLVVGLLTVMLAFVAGMNRLTEGSGNPGNVIVLADGSTDESFSSLSGEYTVKVLPQDIKREIIKDSRGNFLSSREVYVIINQPIEGATTGRKRRFVQMRGVEEPLVAAEVHDIELYPGGEWFPRGGFQKRVRQVNGKEVTETLYELAVGEGVAKDMGADRGKPSLEVGDVINIGPVKWVVTGIMKSSGSTVGSEVWAMSSPVRTLFNKKDFSSIITRTKDLPTAREAAKQLKAFKASPMEAQAEKDYFAKLGQTNQQFLFTIIFVAVIMAVGGVLGVMNTMFAAISQRTKDIGVMRILGFTREQVLVSFLVESLFIALLGGLLGCALGSLTDGVTASSIVSSGAGGGKSVVLQLTVDANTLATGLLFTMLMGAIGGLVPSLSAMRLRPLESLR